MKVMDSSAEVRASGLFEARYIAFLETVAHLRLRLHRYCSRMVGSVLDGEDIVQDALFPAYRTLDTFDDQRPLAPWLFRIAHKSVHRLPSTPRRPRRSGGGRRTTGLCGAYRAAGCRAWPRGGNTS
jgi:hypothetical protein